MATEKVGNQGALLTAEGRGKKLKTTPAEGCVACKTTLTEVGVAGRKSKHQKGRGSTTAMAGRDS